MEKKLRQAGITRRILVIDDEPDLVRLMTRILSKAGYEPVGASCPDEALRLFEMDPDFLAVITDLVMPGGDGLSLTARIREISPRIPVILVTGTGHQLTDQEACSQGITRVLRKPFLPENLREVVVSVLA
jgi:DNA-binding NtrC family response regulator